VLIIKVPYRQPRILRWYRPRNFRRTGVGDKKGLKARKKKKLDKKVFYNYGFIEAFCQ